MELIDNQYKIDGIDVLELCNKYNTPLYVYETAKMEAQYKKLLNAFKNTNIKIYYACKALSNISILKFFKSLNTGLDTVSLQEIYLGLKAGFKPNDIIYTPNCISFNDIEEAIQNKVKINIDNLSILEQFGHLYGNKVPVCIRINPHINAGGNSKISVGHIDSKFGISIHQVPHIERIVKVHNIKIEGVHMHTGSDILDIDVFLQGAEILFNVAKKFDSIKYIDLGSGFKISYKENDINTNIEELGAKLTIRFNQFCKDYGKKITLVFEPGKFLVSEAGYFFVKVNIIKQTTSTVFAGVDSGMNHFIRPMFYDAYHHIINISNPHKNPRLYSVVGYICETDTFGWNRIIPEIREEDILGFLNAGAYCFSMASNYNSRYKPAEVLIHKGKDYLIRKRENINDLLNNQIIVNYD